MTSNYTTIRVSRTTLDKLATFGKKGQTYDQIINELLQKGDNRNAKNV